MSFTIVILIILIFFIMPIILKAIKKITNQEKIVLFFSRIDNYFIRAFKDVSFFFLKITMYNYKLH